MRHRMPAFPNKWCVSRLPGTAGSEEDDEDVSGEFHLVNSWWNGRNGEFWSRRNSIFVFDRESLTVAVDDTLARDGVQI